MQERRNKRLCKYCDEKYEPGHKCRRQIYLLDGKADGGMVGESEEPDG